MSLSNISELLSQKYVVSPLDDVRYCRANGQFKRHLRDHGFDSYRSFFSKTYPELIRKCEYCESESSFSNTSMTYNRTCGNRKCQGKLTANILADRDSTYWSEVITKRLATVSDKGTEYQQRVIAKRVATCISRDAYTHAVSVREQTCMERYGDSKYNNSKQISTSKLNWTPQRKQLYHDRFLAATNGKKLYEFHTAETWYNRSIRLHARGLVAHPSIRTEIKLYRLAVQRLTERNYKQYKHIINPNNYTRTTKKDCVDAYHLDHIIPIMYGFMHAIPADVIAAIDNLQMLHYRENIVKGAKYENI